jgi:hypothetical protein
MVVAHPDDACPDGRMSSSATATATFEKRCEEGFLSNVMTQIEPAGEGWA